jgi:hypothetical protein
MLDGATLVGQQDGTLDTVVDNTHWTQRPMWDGGADTSRVSTDKTTQYQFGHLRQPLRQPDHVADPAEHLAESAEHLAEPAEHRAEPAKHAAEPAEHLATDEKHLADHAKHAAEPAKHVCRT